MVVAWARRAWYVFLMSSGGMFVLGWGGVCSTRGRRVRHSCRGRVRCAKVLTGRCFLSRGEGTFVHKSRGRQMEERPFVRCLDESWALKEEREGKDRWSLAEAGLALGGRQATRRVARQVLYLEHDTIGVRQAWRDRMEVRVGQILFAVHLWTLCHKLFMPRGAEGFGVRTSALYVSIVRRRPLAMLWKRKGLTHALRRTGA